MNGTPRHNVFVSYHDHDEDRYYKRKFVTMMEGYFVNRSVEDGDIDDLNIKTETIRQRIRDEFIREATVTVVLIGPCTWQRKHVDWEIGSSLRDTKLNRRCGLLGILLPNHPDAAREKYNRRLIPPRLADNCGRDGSGFALIYDWSNDRSQVRKWIHAAFKRRTEVQPDNSRRQFTNNRSGDCWRGWQ